MHFSTAFLFKFHLNTQRVTRSRGEVGHHTTTGAQRPILEPVPDTRPILVPSIFLVRNERSHLLIPLTSTTSRRRLYGKTFRDRSHVSIIRFQFLLANNNDDDDRNH